MPLSQEDWLNSLNATVPGAQGELPQWPQPPVPQDPFERAALRQRRAVMQPSAMPDEQANSLAQGVFDTAVPQSLGDAALMVAAGPWGRMPVRAAIGALGAALDPSPAEAGPLGAVRKVLSKAARGGARSFTDIPTEINAGVNAPINKAAQTVAEPYRMMYPGIYSDPREIARIAAERVAPENPAMKQLWGVTRGDLNEMAAGRVGNTEPTGVISSIRPRGSVSAQNIMTPGNTQRLVDILDEAGKMPGLRHADAWYTMDPVYKRIEQMGSNDPAGQYRHLNTMMSMASPGSNVLTEIQRGTLAHALERQGRFGDFMKYAGVAGDARGADFPADMRYVDAHPYHKTSQALPMQQYLERGNELRSEAPKVPLYAQASGVPQTGFQTSAPVGDAHFSRGVGLADTRKGPTDVGASFSRPEYETLTPWWKNNVAGALGIQSVPAQARLWTALGPQTGVESALGQGKLELLSQQIMVAAKRLGVSPEKARDLILSGKAGAGALAGGVGLNALQQNLPQEQQY